MSADRKTKNSMGARQRVVILAVVGILAFAHTVLGTEDYGELVKIARAEGDEYITLRDALQASHPTPWDVNAAAEHSWEAGLAAFILSNTSAVCNA